MAEIGLIKKALTDKLIRLKKQRKFKENSKPSN
jgi:hypothetical protein